MATAQEIINSVRDLIQDEDSVRWTDAELIIWINEALNHIVDVKPEAHITVDDAFSTAAGARQDLPASAVMLIDVTHNVSTGRAISYSPMHVLNTERPNWRSEPFVANVKHYMYDTRKDKQKFLLYPPPPAEHVISLQYSSLPTEVTAVEDVIDMHERYTLPIVNYVVYRAFSKDSDFAGNDGLAKSYYDSFLRLLGVQKQAIQQETPEREAPSVNEEQ